MRLLKPPRGAAPTELKRRVGPLVLPALPGYGSGHGPQTTPPIAKKPEEPVSTAIWQARRFCSARQP